MASDAPPPPPAVALMVWFGHVPEMLTFAPAMRLGVDVPVPPFATDKGSVSGVLPMTLQMFVAVHPKILPPGAAELLKKSCPT